MESNKKWRENNKEKTVAHWTLANAIRYGHISKKPCVFCKAGQNLHGHHADYGKPLDVTWMCSHCHRILHSLLKGETLHYADERKPPRKAHHKKFQPARKRDALFAAAHELRGAGKSYREIAEATGASQGTIYKWLNDTNYT